MMTHKPNNVFKSFGITIGIIILLLSSSMSVAVHIKGDVNNDGSVTAADALLYLRYSVGQDISPYNIDPATDDVTCDGRITAADALKIIRKAVGQNIDIECLSSITYLRSTSRAPDYINWVWTDPSESNFNHVEVYINGAFKQNVTKGIQYYHASGLDPYTNYEISTLTVDTSGNKNTTWVNDTQITVRRIRFVTIGDTHINVSTTTDAYKNFTRAINYINNMTDVDFVVQMGDIADDGSNASLDTAKSLIDRLNKNYYVVEGNHDMGSTSGGNFRNHFGPTEHIENINGYQLIFVGIVKNGTMDSNGTIRTYDWSFDYSHVDKSKPTIIFNHGPVQPKPGKTCSDWDSNSSRYINFSYACNMKPNVDSFSRLLGYYAGHVHEGSNQTINGALYVTEDNIGGAVVHGPNSEYVGYTAIQDGVVDYRLVNYDS